LGTPRLRLVSIYDKCRLLQRAGQDQRDTRLRRKPRRLCRWCWRANDGTRANSSVQRDIRRCRQTA